MLIPKDIWLINQYAMPPKYESRLRTIKMAHYLSKKGYNVTIFASSVMHNMNIDLIDDDSLYVERVYDDLHFVHIKTRQYKKTTGISRILGSFQFPLRLLKIAKIFSKPDIIIQTATVPFGNVLLRLKKKFSITYIVEVLDLWPNSLVELGVMSEKSPIAKLLYRLEYSHYKKADHIVFSQEGGPDYLKDRGWNIENGGELDMSKVHYINNGVDLEDFNSFKSQYILKDEDLSNDDLKKVVYIGSIRLANNVENLVNAAKLMKDRTDIKFLIYGNGDDRPRLEARIKEEGVSNVIFKQTWIDPTFVPYVLSKSTVNVLNYMPGHFGTYGGSQSKMFQYMASGKPICCNLKMMYCPISKYNIGIAKEYSSLQEYADSIIKLIDLPKDEYNAMCNRARKAVEDFDFKVLTDKVERIWK